MPYFIPGVCAADDPPLLPREVAPGVPKEKMMEEYLRNLGLAALDKRKAALEKLIDAGIAEWQNSRRHFFLRQIGGLPDKCTPLNARITVCRMESRNGIRDDQDSGCCD